MGTGHFCTRHHFCTVSLLHNKNLQCFCFCITSHFYNAIFWHGTSIPMPLCFIASTESVKNKLETTIYSRLTSKTEKTKI